MGVVFQRPASHRALWRIHGAAGSPQQQTIGPLLERLQKPDSERNRKREPAYKAITSAVPAVSTRFASP
jgi:hypothetical protein